MVWARRRLVNPVLDEILSWDNVVLAYEPVWATGKVASRSKLIEYAEEYPISYRSFVDKMRLRPNMHTRHRLPRDHSNDMVLSILLLTSASNIHDDHIKLLCITDLE
ncbi:triosephosphate isomerase, chloroplastic [Tanacetum coccineum]